MGCPAGLPTILLAGFHLGGATVPPSCGSSARDFLQDFLQGFLRDFPQDLLRELLELRGDEGARQVIVRHRHRLHLVPLPAEHALTDLDTPQAWAAWRAQQG